MMKGDEKKITRRFLFVIILTPSGVAGEQLRAATLTNCLHNKTFSFPTFSISARYSSCFELPQHLAQPHKAER